MTMQSQPINRLDRSRSMRGTIWLALAAGILLACATTARANDTGIEAHPLTRDCMMNEVVMVRVVIRNPSQASMPTPPEGDGYEIRYSGSGPSTSHSTTIVNNRMTQRVEYTYVFELTPLRPGRLNVGPFTWRDGNRAYKTAPFNIRVGESGDRDPLFVTRVRANRDKVYMGEPLKLELEIWVKKYRQAGLGELDPNGMFRRLDGSNSKFGIFSEAANSPPKYRETSLPPELRSDDANNQRSADDYIVFIYETTHIPRKPGKLDLGNIIVACDYPVRLSQPRFFRVDDNRPPRRLRSKPELPDITVKSIPLAGRPEHYNGAVGSFQLSTMAAPTEVPVGDPITLTLNLHSRNAPLEGLGAPILSEVPALTRDFEVSNESLAGEVRGNTKVFAQTIRPLREDVSEIPAIPFSYFDPAREKYETAWSDPIPLNVSPAKRVAIAAAGDREVDAPALTPLVETTDGLQANHADIDAMLADQSASIGIGTYALLGAMPTLYLAAAAVGWRSRKNEANADVRRRSRALREAKSKLSGARSPGDVLAAILAYAADRFDGTAGSMTRREAVQRATAHGASSETATRLDDLLASLEAAQYAGAGGIDASASASQANTLLASIESEVKG